MAIKLQFESDDDKDDYKDKRQVPRCYPVVELPIYDVDDPTLEGLVWDISEKGVQVAGIEARIDQRKTFFIQANDFGSFNPFSFEAECRWVTTESQSGLRVCGFEILGISDKDMEELRTVIDLLALSD